MVRRLIRRPEKAVRRRGKEEQETRLGVPMMLGW